MNNTTLQIKFKQRLNKLASEDFDNIQCWEIVEAFNKAQLEWCRRQLRGANPFKDGDEMSKRRVDDLQILLKTMGLTGEDVEYDDEFGYFKAENFLGIYDDDYLEFKKIETKASQVIPCECNEGKPEVPGVPGQPGTDPIYGERPIIEPGTEAEYWQYNEGEPAVYGANDQYCRVGFYERHRTTEVMEALNSGEFTDEELAARFPIVECTYTSTATYPDYPNDYPDNPTWSLPWDDTNFCECVGNVASGVSEDDCNLYGTADNYAMYDWAVGDEDGMYDICIEIPDSGKLLEEGTPEYWECLSTGEITEQDPEGAPCVEGTEPIYGERPILVPGTDPIDPIDPIPAEPAEPCDPIIHPGADKNNCCDENRSMTVYLSEVANVDVILRDPLKNPDFDWSETICTLQNNEVRIWRKNFFIVDPKLIYYRKPVNIQVKGCINPDTNVESISEIPCEFKDDIVELIIDEAVSIVAGDIMDVNQFARGSQSAEKNN